MDWRVVCFVLSLFAFFPKGTDFALRPQCPLQLQILLVANSLGETILGGVEQFLDFDLPIHAGSAHPPTEPTNQPRQPNQTNQPTNQPASQPASQPTNPPINQPIHQPNQSNQPSQTNPIQSCSHPTWPVQADSLLYVNNLKWVTYGNPTTKPTLKASKHQRNRIRWFRTAKGGICKAHCPSKKLT